MQTPHANEGMICPLHKADMSTVCHKCPWWTQVRGKHPQTEEMLDDWRCAVQWLPILMIETSQQMRGVGAATESMRNALVSNVVEAVTAAADQTTRRMIDAGNPDRNRQSRLR